MIPNVDQSYSIDRGEQIMLLGRFFHFPPTESVPDILGVDDIESKVLSVLESVGVQNDSDSARHPPIRSDYLAGVLRMHPNPKNDVLIAWNDHNLNILRFIY